MVNNKHLSIIAVLFCFILIPVLAVMYKTGDRIKTYENSKKLDSPYVVIACASTFHKISENPQGMIPDEHEKIIVKNSPDNFIGEYRFSFMEEIESVDKIIQIECTPDESIMRVFLIEKEN